MLSGSFFLIKLIILLLGMIVDTFAVLRAENEFRESDLENVCLICGINRITLDKRIDLNS